MIADLSRTDFVARFGGVYEHSRWVAEKCFEDGMHHTAVLPSDLAGPMSHLVEAAGPKPQMILLRAHPDLAGKLARSGTLTAESTSEQAGAGLDECTEAEFQEFTALNTAYRKKFGFPYILAVKGRHRTEILENFRKRVPNDMAAEFREALNQVHQIAKLRLTVLDG
ncbi:MAG: 2-oxo-4-hydroxy-4-carboxy-5-ureidoimidazoline decarboxylase [Proteobacteria bacterium]|nr:2-oxo-4-hydroxy-4-carboxy-5-ureidoimidazoline decarboxylase [Pseudomonadota bacterium]MDA1287704.1 2-oxo-4-hydroxy-4-carboxy-5-ureidoimidazoline decarboxylase [Pseudomonadota bacterium]